MPPEAEANLMDDLASAWDDVEIEETENVDESPDTTPEPAAEELSGGRSEVEGDPDPDLELVPDGKDEIVEGTVEVPDDTDSAPLSLPPAAREAWKDTPKAVREALIKRDTDYEAGIVKYADNAKRAQQMDQVLAPFQQFFASAGAPPQATLNGLLQTASSLQMGNPVQQAQTVATLIKQFGVDIKTLDNILTGQGAPANVQRQTDVQQQIGAALAPFQQYMSREKQRQDYTQQQERNEVNGTLNAFAADPQNEFYNDVKMEMADLLDMASNRNREMTLAQAYEKACQLNPEIYGIIQGRIGAKSVAEKRHAAASISGTLGGPGGGTEPGDMRGAIEDAWANAGRA